MAKENKVEYERVDEKTDKYKRVLVKFNPSFWTGSDFEVEFVPILNAVEVGRVFVTEIDSMSSIDLYRWVDRQLYLTKGLDRNGRGVIVTKKLNSNRAELMKRSWRQGNVEFEPRQIISRVKRVFEGIAKEYSEPTAYAYNHFLHTGQIGSFPFDPVFFNIRFLKYLIEEYSFRCKGADGEIVERSLVEHLFDTHKTKYIVSPGAVNLSGIPL